jgi:hypothetical protein
MVQSRLGTGSLRIIFSRRRRTAVWAAVPRRGDDAALAAARHAGSAGWQGDLPEIELPLAGWQADGFAFYDFDRRVEALAAAAGAGDFAVRLCGEPSTPRPALARAARQVAARCQRLHGWRNAAASGESFELMLAGHRQFYEQHERHERHEQHERHERHDPEELHELQDPARSPAAAIQAHAHALDTWQWLLRLDPEADLALQLAALFHDLGRLSGEDETGERPGAASGPDSEDERSRRGAWMADELLAELGLDLATRVRVYRLISGHGKQPATAAEPEDADLALLGEADALSFLSLDSAGCLARHGAERTAQRVARALGHLRPRSHAHLDALRLRTAVERMVATELTRLAAAPAVPAADPAVVSGMAGIAAAGGGSPGPLGTVRTLTAALPRLAANGGDGDGALGGVVGALAALGTTGSPAAGLGRPTPAMVMARSRRAVGMLGGAGIARTRVGALLARAAALGALGAATRPARLAGVAAGMAPEGSMQRGCTPRHRRPRP